MADRRLLWLKKLFVDLSRDYEMPLSPIDPMAAFTCQDLGNDAAICTGPRPLDALQAFGGRVDRLKNAIHPAQAPSVYHHSVVPSDKCVPDTDSKSASSLAQKVFVFLKIQYI